MQYAEHAMNSTSMEAEIKRTIESAARIQAEHLHELGMKDAALQIVEWGLGYSQSSSLLQLRDQIVSDAPID
jgi:hypothetical protein